MKLLKLVFLCIIGAAILLLLLVFVRQTACQGAPRVEYISTNKTNQQKNLKGRSNVIQMKVLRQEPRPNLWTDKIHLCVNFNLNMIKPTKNVSDLLISYYHPFFKNITFIFNGNWSKPDYVPEYVDFISCDSHIGWYQHKCIRSCIHRGSEETKGFLYIADDMFINLTKMAELPTTKLWYIESEVRSYSCIQNGCDWVWWGPPTYQAKKLDIVINSLPDKWKEQLVKTAGFPDNFKAYACSDIIYIPQALVTNMTDVLDHIINTAELFCEISTNLAMNIVAPDKVYLVNGYLWNNKGIAAIKQRANTAHFVHPVKLGIQAHRDIWIQYMEKQLSISNKL